MQLELLVAVGVSGGKINQFVTNFHFILSMHSFIYINNVIHGGRFIEEIKFYTFYFHLLLFYFSLIFCRRILKLGDCSSSFFRLHVLDLAMISELHLLEIDVYQWYQSSISTTMADGTRLQDHRRFEESIQAILQEIMAKIQVQDTNITALGVQQGQMMARLQNAE